MNRKKGFCLYVLLLLILCHGIYAGPASTQPAVSVTDTVVIVVPDVWAMPGDTIYIPVFALYDVPDEIFAVTLDFAFDPDRVALVGEGIDTVGTITAGWASMFASSIIDTNDTHTLRMVWAAVNALSGSGCFTKIVLRARTDAPIGDQSPFIFKDCLVNEGTPACLSQNGSLTVNEPPTVQLTEVNHDFGSVQVGQEGKWTLTVTNAGDNTLEIYALNPSDSQFETAGGFPLSIAAGESTDISVTFRPNKDGFTEAHLRLFSNDLAQPVWDIPVLGTGWGTGVQVLSFWAERREENVLLRWKIGLASDHLGFYLYRSAHMDGGFARVSDELITGEDEFLFIDKAVSRGHVYYYRLNAVDIAGHEETVGRATVDASAPGPNGYMLYQNYPNPFNPTTNLVFSVETEGSVSLSVFNALGQEVRQLFKGFVSPGQHTQSWDGLDTFGKAVPSGMYVCRLHGPAVDLSTRMLLLR